MVALLWYNFQRSPHVYQSSQYILRVSHTWLKNVNISIGVFLLEKQNWYYRDQLVKIWIMLTVMLKGKDFEIIS